MTVRRAALLLIGACCSTSPGTPPAPNHRPTADALDAAGAHPMTEMVGELVTFLSADVTVDDISARLGPVASDPGVPMPITLTPRDAGVQAASIGRYPDDGKPFTIELELASPIPVTELSALLGAYQQARTHRGMPREIVFPPAGTGPWKIVVVASVPPGASPLADQAAGTITFRRDPP